MTNNKHKEIMERVPKYKNGSTAIPKDEIVVPYSVFLKALTEQLEELERWVESKRTYQHSKGGDEGWNGFNGDWETFNESIGYHKALNDILSHLHSEKEIIKK